MLSIADPLDTPPCSGHTSFHSISLCMAEINSFSGSAPHQAKRSPDPACTAKGGSKRENIDEKILPPSIREDFTFAMRTREGADYGCVYSERDARDVVRSAEVMLDQIRTVVQT